MYSYFIGNIVEVNKNSITLDVNNIGYEIIVKNNEYKINMNNIKIYIVHVLTETSQTLYGFKDKKEKELFHNLINVKSVGPKLALNILQYDYYENIINAVALKDYKYLLQIPKIGNNTSELIIKKLSKLYVSINLESNNEVVLYLEQLGYSKQEIYNVINKVDKNINSKEMIKQALKLI